jgi:hypothetical protein
MKAAGWKLSRQEEAVKEVFLWTFEISARGEQEEIGEKLGSCFVCNVGPTLRHKLLESCKSYRVDFQEILDCLQRGNRLKHITLDQLGVVHSHTGNCASICLVLADVIAQLHQRQDLS